ncbi:MAG: O-antigen ligase family protein [Mycobacterium sp.]
MTRLDANPAWQPALKSRSSRLIVGACVVATVFGLLLPAMPWYAVAWLVLVPLALALPVGALAVILAVTVLVPWDLQSALKVIGGPDQPGVLFVDALMVLGLIRIAWLMLRRRLTFDLPLLLGTVIAGLCVGALMWGIGTGANVSEAGHEWRRVMLGVASFLLAWPLMSSRSARRQLIWVLMAIGLALGVWGFVQWAFSVGYTTAGDIGVRGGLDSGQLQGGLYAYPAAVALAWAALVSGQVRNVAARWLLPVILIVNAVCVVLTFERTLLVATAVSCVFVVVSAGPDARARAMKWAAIGAALLVVGGTVAQTEAQTVTERLAMVGDPNSDHSFTHRVVESQELAKVIAERPITGSGFGATVTWGVRDVYATSTTSFADMGYLWLIWKIGIPAALLIVFLIWRAILRRPDSADTGEWRALRLGSRAALLALMIIGLLFGVFNSLGITAVMGVLVAVCYSGAVPPDSDPFPAPHGGSHEH